MLFGAELKDVLNDMYVIKRDVLDEIIFGSKSFGIESKIVVHVVNMGETISEVLIKCRKRLGEKKLRIKHGLNIPQIMVMLS